MNMKDFDVVVVNTGYIDTIGSTESFTIINNIDDLYEAIEFSKKEYIIIVPDTGLYMLNNILSIVSREQDFNALFMVLKPRGILSKIIPFHPIPIIMEITGLENVFSIVSKREFMKELISHNKPGSLCNKNHIIVKHYKPPLSYYLLLLSMRLPKPLAIALREPRRVLKFGLVGLTGSIVNILVVTFSAEILGILGKNPLLLAIPGFLGFETSLTWNFIFHEIWTFRDMRLPRDILNRLKRYLKYHVASAASLVTQVATIMLLSGLLGIYLPLATAIGIVLGFAANYMIGRLYTWTPTTSA